MVRIYFLLILSPLFYAHRASFCRIFANNSQMEIRKFFANEPISPPNQSAFVWRFGSAPCHSEIGLWSYRCIAVPHKAAYCIDVRPQRLLCLCKGMPQTVSRYRREIIFMHDRLQMLFENRIRNGQTVLLYARIGRHDIVPPLVAI